MTSVRVIRGKPQYMWCCGQLVVKYTLVPVRAAARTYALAILHDVGLYVFFYRFPMEP